MWAAARGSKSGLDKLYSWVEKITPATTAPVHKANCEDFWPTTLDRECDKAARIIKSFCRDGFHHEEEVTATDGSATHSRTRVLKRIPAPVVKDAQGLAVFTVLRAGLWNSSGSGGSGVLVARKADGGWSSPCAIQVDATNLAFAPGVDLYDCVLVISTPQILQALAHVSASIGGNVIITTGPVDLAAIVQMQAQGHQPPVYSYSRSRGSHAALRLDGSTVLVRMEENERYYGEMVAPQDILSGRIRHPHKELRGFYETLKDSEGQRNLDNSLFPAAAPPSDFDLIQGGQVFGVPDRSDPDPYGVLQLEKEGMIIREAGTQERASWQQFTYSPALTPPARDSSNRRTFTGSSSRASSFMAAKRSNARLSTDTSILSEVRSVRDTAPMSPVTISLSDMGTQTDDLPPPPASWRGSSSRQGSASMHRRSMEQVPEHEVVPSSPSTHSRPGSFVGTTRSIQSAMSKASTPPTKSSVSGDERRLDGHGEASASEAGHDGDAEVDTVDDDDDDENDGDTDLDDDEQSEVVIVARPTTVQTIVAARPAQPVMAKARMVTLPKRGPPPVLPTRNPQRSSTSTIGSSSHRRPSSPLSLNAPLSPPQPPSDDNLAAVTPTKKRSDSSPLSSARRDDRSLSPQTREMAALTAGPAAADAYLEQSFGNPAAAAAVSPPSSAYTTNTTTAAATPASPGSAGKGDVDPWDRVLARHGSVDATATSHASGKASNVAADAAQSGPRVVAGVES